MRFGSLFSGIGGIDLGLERAGMECAFQVENEPYCLKVLAKHWPNVTRYEDIGEVDFGRVERVDLLAGGFPCQDLSYAGKGAGLSGERSGLWGEFVRAIRVVRPRYVLIENVPGLLGRGMGVVLGDLCALGYDAEWESIPATAFGAPHLRWRVFIVAYTSQLLRNGSNDNAGSHSQSSSTIPEPGNGSSASDVAHSEQVGRRGLPDAAGWDDAHGQETGWEEGASRSEQCGEDVALPKINGRAERRPGQPTSERSRLPDGETAMGDSDAIRRDGRSWVFGARWGREPADTGWWATEPAICRVANGVPRRVDRLRGLGNAVVPQVAQWLGERILEHEAA